MSESDKHRFLDSPISQAGLFSDAVESFAQQFSVIQKRTEAVGHILLQRPAAVITLPPVAAPPPTRRQGRPPAAPTFAPVRPQQQPSLRPQRGAGSRKVAQPVSAPARPVKCQGKRRSWDGRTRDTGSCSSGDGESAPSPRWRAGWKILFSLFGLFRHWLSLASGTQTFRAVSYVSSSQGGEDGSARNTVSTPSSPSSFASGQQGPVRGRDAFSRAPCPAVEPGKCRTVHSDPTSGRVAFLVGSLCSTSLPHRGYVCGSPGPTCTVSGGLASAPQAVSLASENHQTRLRDSVRPASSQVQGRSVHLCVEQRCSCLACRIAVLLAKDAIEPVPPAEMKSGFYSPYFILPKKSGGLRPILDLRVLNRALHKLLFRMLMQKHIFQCIRPFDWFAAIDLKDAYFHVSISPQHRPFFHFAFEGRAYQYKVLPFGHLSRLGLRVNWERSKLSHGQRISFLGMELDSVNLTARLSIERAQSMLNCLESFQRKRAVPLKQFQRLLGHMASAAAVTPLGLLHMRLLQRWLHDRVPRWAWRCGTYRVSVTPSCLQTFSPWSDLAFLRAGVPLVQVSRHVVVSTDASAMGWGTMCNGHAAAGLWTGPRLQWHVNCLELLAVWLALRRFKMLLNDKHVLVCTDNTATVAYINHQGGLRSRHMSQLARHLLLGVRSI